MRWLVVRYLILLGICFLDKIEFVMIIFLIGVDFKILVVLLVKSLWLVIV